MTEKFVIYIQTDHDDLKAELFKVMLHCGGALMELSNHAWQKCKTVKRPKKKNS